MDSEFIAELRRVCTGSTTAAVVTIIEVKGSAPRKPGTKMLVLPDGQIIGTIGGGCGEAEVRREALTALTLGQSSVYKVDLTNDIAADEGMVCGGIMTVLIDVIGSADRSKKDLWLAYLSELVMTQEPLLITLIQARGKVAGKQMVLTRSGQQLGDLGEASLNELVGQQVQQLPGSGKTMLFTLPLPEGEVKVLFEPAAAVRDLLILGGGHIATPLAAMAQMLGYRVTVVDDRPAFANKQRFPAADKVICNSFTAALDTVELNSHSFVVIVTRGHKHDHECLRRVLAHQDQPAYIGMIGSKRRVKALMLQLQEEGFAPELLQTVYAPIGLYIGAETPEEIAVSILAQLINVHRGGRA